MAARGSFDSRLGFILASAGSAVGLGNIWKFPFEVGQGGGAAFVVIYLICCFVLCYPIMVAEIAIGRKTQRNAVGAFNALGFKSWNFVGYLGVIAGLVILSFYNVIAAWAFGYFWEIIGANFAIGQQFGEFTANWVKVGLYAIIFMSTTAFVVSRGISGGIERAAKILMPVLLVLVLGLVAYAMTLDHSMVGLKFYLQPDFSKVTPSVVYSALSQAFFSLSLGMGALITFGSYVSRQTNIVSAGAIITVTDVSVAVLAGLMMFPFVAYMTQGDLDAMKAVSGGPGFIFVTLPGIFESLGPMLGRIVGGVFFLLLSFAAFTSTMSLMEVPAAYLVDEKKISRPKATWILATAIFLIGIPSLLSYGAVEMLGNLKLPGVAKSMPFLDIVAMISDIILPLGGFLIATFVTLAWKRRNFDEELAVGDEALRGSWLQGYVNFSIAWICPFILGAMFIITILETFFGMNIIN